MSDEPPRPPLIRRKPQPPPESDTILRGSAPLGSAESLLPSGSIGSDLATDWIPIADAVDLIAADVGGVANARAMILQRIYTGLIPVSCVQLNIDRWPGRRFLLQKVAWPGAEARLGEQMLRAARWTLKFDWQTGDASWSDHLAALPFHCLMQSVHVAREAVAALIARRAPTAPAADVKPSAKAIVECRDWLLEQFADVATATKKKAYFEAEADILFADRLSVRGFKSAWTQATEKFPDRRKAGAPKAG